MLLRPPLRPLLRPVLRSPLERGGGFSPNALFAPSDPGDWWDASDLSRMRQDSAGLTAAAVGQPVGWMLGGRDKILRFQTTSANRPTLTVDANGRYRLSYNGTNSWMQTSAVDFSGTDKMTVVGAWTKLSDAAVGVVVEASANSNLNAGAFYITAPNNAGVGNVVFFSRGDVLTAAGASAVGLVAPKSLVITAQSHIAGDSQIIRVNGTQAGTSASDQGAGNYGNHALYFGARAGTSLFFNGNEYISAICGASKTETLIARMERYAAAKAGITL